MYSIYEVWVYITQDINILESKSIDDYKFSLITNFSKRN